MEALNPASDPLAQLKDIHLPEQVHNYPIAFGWWFILACVLLYIIFMIIKWKKRQQIHKSQKLALAQLNNIKSNDELVTLLKWTSFQYFPRSEVASLHSEALQSFLASKLAAKNHDKFQTLCAQHLKNKYQIINNNSLDESLKEAAKLWLSYAIPPKEIKHKAHNKAGVVS
jgi:hypothetical protein